MAGLERPNTAGNSDFLSFSNELFTAAGGGTAIKTGVHLLTLIFYHLNAKKRVLDSSSIPLFCIVIKKLLTFQSKCNGSAVSKWSHTEDNQWKTPTTRTPTRRVKQSKSVCGCFTFSCISLSSPVDGVYPN